jgi:hypothetical protein
MGQYHSPIILNVNNYKKEDKNENKILAWLYPHKFDCGTKLMEFSYVGNSVMNAVETLLERGKGLYTGNRLVFGGDYADDEDEKYSDGNGANLHFLADDIEPTMPENTKRLQYAINEETKEYIDLDAVKPDKWGLKIHPIALLCDEGNGLGGGDYRGINEDVVGSWARNIITFSDEKPFGFKEFKVEFKEEF